MWGEEVVVGVSMTAGLPKWLLSIPSLSVFT